MPNTPTVLLCRYHYDPLDRLAGRKDAGQGGGLCFYQKNRLTTEIQGQARRSWLQTPQQLLAQQRCTADISDAALIATDAQGSVLHGLDASQTQAYAYSAYGSRHPALDPLHLPGFNRERADPVTGHYLLGNGYRAFNPVLMRFNSPDSESPFDKGGLNAYAYCAGDPVNRVDPSGHRPAFFKKFMNKLGLGKKARSLPSNGLAKDKVLDRLSGLELERSLFSGQSHKTLQELSFETMSVEQLSAYKKSGSLPPYLSEKLEVMDDVGRQEHSIRKRLRDASAQERVDLVFYSDYFNNDRFFYLPQEMRNGILAQKKLRHSMRDVSAEAASAYIRKAYPHYQKYFK